MGSLLIWQLAAILVMFLVSLCYRVDLLPFKLFALFFGLSLLVSVALALLSLGVNVYRIYQTGFSSIAGRVMGFGFSFIVIVLFSTFIVQIKKYPPIHDITTDVNDPPVFKQALFRRKPSDNSLDGSIDIDKQLAFYEGINTVESNLALSEVFPLILSIAKDMQWHIHFADETTGTIEAEVTSPLLGFVDDIVVRVRTDEQSTYIDLRSASRVGVSDLGANAKRIKQFLVNVKRQLEGVN